LARDPPLEKSDNAASAGPKAERLLSPADPDRVFVDTALSEPWRDRKWADPAKKTGKTT
jgi:hypothetical protein